MSVDQALYRRVAGSFATGVTVITTGHGGQMHGMTASSFTSVSLEPTLVLISVDKTAQTLPIVRASGLFAVNVLAGEQEALSRAFARRDSPESNLSGVDYRLSASGLPILAGVLAHLECSVVNEVDAGDHVVFIANVDVAGIDDAGETPLLYFRSRYRQFTDA